MPFYENLPNMSSHPFTRQKYNILPATRTKCPVCGHPTGDCSNDPNEPIHIAGVDPKDHLIYVKEDVTQEVTLASGAKTTILVARKGSYITKEKAEEFGIS